MDLFYSYILRSQKTGNLYKGHAEDIGKRLKKHNAGGVKSTRHGVPWNLVYYEAFKERSEAIVRESYFKAAAGRRFIKGLNLDEVVQVPVPE